jgi:hypothetical protein
MLELAHMTFSIVRYLRSHKYTIFALFAFAYSAIAQTYPVIFHLNDRFAGVEMDAYNYAWNIDTFWYEAKQLHNPFYTQRIFYPLTTSLVFHTYAPLLAIPAVFFSNYVLFLNLSVIICIFLSGYLTYLLTRELSKSALSGILAGVFFTSSTIIWSYVYSSHYYYIHALPLLLLSLLWFYKFYLSGKVRYFVYLSLTITLCFFLDYYTTIFLAIMLVSLFVYLCGMRSSRGKILAYLTDAATLQTILISTALIVVLPVVLFFFVFTNPSEIFGRVSGASGYPAFCNTNLAEFGFFNTQSRLFGSFMQELRMKHNFAANFDTPEYSIGLVALLLACVGGFMVRKNHALMSLVFAGVVMGFLSLGSVVRFGNIELLSGGYTPFHYFSKLPFLGLIDCPVRMVEGLHLAVAILSAVTLTSLLTRLSQRNRIISLVGIGLIVYFCELSIGMPLADATIPTVYSRLATYPEKSLLELPSGIIESKDNFGNDWSIPAIHTKQLFWQITHRKPRLGGYLSRLPPDYYTIYKSEPVLSDFFAFTGANGTWSGKNFTDEEISHFIRKYNLGYVVFSPNSRQLSFRTEFARQFAQHIERTEEYDGFVLYSIK